MNERHLVEEVVSCGVSDTAGFTTLWDLPRLPLTEAFGFFDKDYPTYDQELVISKISGHVQVRFQLNPETLYIPDQYMHRTKLNQKTSKELEYLWRFISEHSSSDIEARIVEFGASNLAFAKLMAEKSNGKVMACDPLLKEVTLDEEQGNLAIVGLAIEAAMDQVENFAPTLVVARHTLEHVADPLSMLSNLFASTDENAIFVFEVPSLKNLAGALRFDAIFHQHLQYFDIESARQLAWNAGGRVINHIYNHQGSNGGSLIFAIAKGRDPLQKGLVDVSGKEAWLRRQIGAFENQMVATARVLDDLDSNRYGFGAGLMLSTLDYHLNGRISDLSEIRDDDETKNGLQYKNVDVQVVSTHHAPIDEEGIYLVTALENSRAIVNRLSSAGVRKIIAPIVL